MLGLACLVLAVAAASWFLATRSGGGARPSAGGTGSTARAGAGGETASPGTSPDAPPPGSVTIAPAASGNAAAPGIARFLEQYFNAVNSHDYRAYLALFTPDMRPSGASEFDSGDGSTTDTDEVLSGISAGPGGEVVAHLTFTSHQNPSQSPNRASCDTWDINLYLIPDSGSYLIDKPPSSYHARYKTCT